MQPGACGGGWRERLALNHQVSGLGFGVADLSSRLAGGAASETVGVDGHEGLAADGACMIYDGLECMMKLPVYQ